jgi:DNA-binding MarR family transcriptional regulator
MFGRAGENLKLEYISAWDAPNEDPDGAELHCHDARAAYNSSKGELDKTVSMGNYVLVSMEMHTKHPPLRRKQPALYFERHIGYWMRRVSGHLQGASARALQTRHTSVAEWIVLCLILERPGITPAELAESLTMTRGAISKIIDKLEAKNWVACSAKPGDGRVHLLSLTRRGTQIHPQLGEMLDQNERKIFGSLEVDERANLRRLLKKLAEIHHTRKLPDVPIK